MCSLNQPLGLDLVKNFNFPFKPYDIQQQFMEKLAMTLNEKKFGIFESPTGTGKSLSLICGSLTWLQEHNKLERDELKRISEEQCFTDDESSDWFSLATKRIEKEKLQKSSIKKLERIEKYEKKIQKLQEFRESKNLQKSNVTTVKDQFDELFKDLKEIREAVKEELRLQKCDDVISHSENDLILDDDFNDDENTEDPDENEEEENDMIKVYYCSRTHSQLSQFMKEIQKTGFRDVIQAVSLASRQNLCINENVIKLSNLSLINERCLDMQNGGKKVTSKTHENRMAKKKKTLSSCPFYKSTLIQNVSNQILVEVQDLEQLITTGKKGNGCPYYASRKSIRDAQLIALPYQTLLHKGTREACKIKLKDNIVIVDEAHNLLETIANINSSVLYYSQICGAHSQLSQYLQRYEKRLSAQNLLYISQIMFLLKAFMKLLSKGPNLNVNYESDNPSFKSRLMMLQEFLHETLTDNINIFKLVQYIERSKIAQKLHGFTQLFLGQVNTKPSEKQNGLTTSDFLANMTSSKSKIVKKENQKFNVASIEQEPDSNDEQLCGSPLLSVVEFLRVITCGSSDGRILLHFDKMINKSFIKFLLLNPASQFHDIVQQCRSIIVAGGTMSPMEEFSNQLFLAAGVSPERLVQFSCGHVVPDKSILPIVLKEGPGGVKLDFTFKNRDDPNVLNDLGRLLVNIINVIPGGVVVFFPSYDYEEKVNKYFMITGILQKLGNKKKIFREPKKASQLEKTLNDYARAIKESSRSLSQNQLTTLTGALIFCVVGGKMSEGINFSDDLGRCVVMVGMPYPNSTSPELKEKITYLNSHYPPNSDGKMAGLSFYENLCFKAVNQSIGRSIRHKDDYSSILLLDHRYSQESSKMQLPNWIRSRVNVCEKFGSAFQLLRKFFADKK